MPAQKPPRGAHLPQFAQPIPTRTAPVYRTDRQTGFSDAALYGLVALSCTVMLLVARPDGAQNLTGKSASVKATAAKGPVLEPSAKVSVEGRRPLDFYTGGVRGGMFAVPIPPEPKPVVVKKKETPKPPPPAPIIPQINPFEGWKYTGTLEMDGVKMALLENPNSPQKGQYVRIGESLMGGTVSSISDQAVTLTSAGKPYTISKEQAGSLTPLSQNAPFMNGQGGQPGQPGMPGQPGGPPPGMNTPQMGMPMGAERITLSNGASLTPQQFQRRTNRLNRRFNR